MIPASVSTYVPFYRGRGYGEGPEQGENYTHFPKQQRGSDAPTNGYRLPSGPAPLDTEQPPPPYPGIEGDIVHNAAVPQTGNYAPPPGPPPAARVNGDVSCDPSHSAIGK